MSSYYISQGITNKQLSPGSQDKLLQMVENLICQNIRNYPAWNLEVGDKDLKRSHSFKKSKKDKDERKEMEKLQEQITALLTKESS